MLRANEPLRRRNNLEWSLKPFLISMKFILGLDFTNVSNLNCVRPVGFLIPAIGFFVSIFFLVVNGPCGLYSYKKENDDDKKFFDYDAPQNRSEEWHGKVKFIHDIIRFPLFLSSPTIHLVFMIKVLFTNRWRNLWGLLQTIHRKMQLDEQFNRKCRRHCFIALSLLVMVNTNTIHNNIKVHDLRS